MNPSTSRRHLRRDSVIAIVAAVCLLAAATGCWVLRVAHAGSTTHPTAAESVVKKHNGFGQIDHATTPSGKTPLKSSGMRRGRPPSQPNLASRPYLSLLAIAPHCSCFGLLVYHAPATTVAPPDLLTHICVDRR